MWIFFNIVLWLLLGALAGCIAGFIMKSKGSLLRNVFIGIIGALLGVFVLSFFDVEFREFSLLGLLVAICGACFLIFISRLLLGKKKK